MLLNEIHKRSLEMLDALEAVCDISPEKVEPEGSKTIWIIIAVVIISIIIFFV